MRRYCRSRATWLVLVAVLYGCGQAGSNDSAAKTEKAMARIRGTGVLQWGADVVGGVPYVYEDANHPGTYIGFEMEIAQAIAADLGVELKLVIKPWDTLIPELQRGSFDMAMNGIENTEERSQIVLYSDPYFVYSQQLTVRKSTTDVSGLPDLSGHKVATLSGTAAEDILRQTPGIQVVTNPEIIYSYRDLEEHRVDAVLLDTPIAAAYGATNPALKNVGISFSEGRYVIAFRKTDTDLRDAVNASLARLRHNGRLKAIYEKYGIMDDHQHQLGIL